MRYSLELMIYFGIMWTLFQPNIEKPTQFHPSSNPICSLGVDGHWEPILNCTGLGCTLEMPAHYGVPTQSWTTIEKPKRQTACFVITVNRTCKLHTPSNGQIQTRGHRSTRWQTYQSSHQVKMLVSKAWNNQGKTHAVLVLSHMMIYIKEHTLWKLLQRVSINKSE